MEHIPVVNLFKRIAADHRFRFKAIAIVLLPMLVAGCSTPIGTRSVGVRQTYEEINRTAIKEDAYSDATARVLHRFFLEERFAKDPEGTLTTLHDIACEDDRRDILFALSELAYLNADKARSGSSKAVKARAPTHYLAAAVYAYYFLLGERGSAPPIPYDRRFRFACDLYNTALGQLLAMEEKSHLLADGNYALPAGSLSIELRHQRFPYQLDRFETILPADTLSVYGLSVRDRHPGLGAPFVAVEKKDPDRPVTRTVAGTLFLRLEGDIRSLRDGVRGYMELYSAYEQREVEVNGRSIPLENDLSAQLAQSLNQPFFWKMGRLQFLEGEILESGVYPLQPYSPGRIPVVFVHGTFSSPIYWSEMFNTLRADSELWNRYQFWFYLYDSSKPIVFSTDELRESLSRMVATLDPEGRDDALEKMVVIGHSQGGLLTKLTATETGDALVRAMTGKGLGELEINDKQRAIVERYMVYEPLPFVNRVIFISTPHRGSFLATNWVRGMVQKFISLPKKVLQQTHSLLTTGKAIGVTRFEHVEGLTSVDAMSPDNPGLLALADVPLAPGIKGHSIIGIDGDEQPPEGDDGVVKYTSAHVDYVESEFIVRHGHSCQQHPLVIEEVRRVLLEHIERLSRFEDQ